MKASPRFIHFAFLFGFSVTLIHAAELTWDPANTANGATIDDGAGDWNTASVWNLTGTNQTWTTGDTAIFAGTVGGTVTGDASTNGITVSGTAAYNFSGAISGAGGLTKNGTGVLTLSGATSNIYTGLTTVTGNGHLILSKTGGATAIGGDITLAASTPGASPFYTTLATSQNNQFAAGAVFRLTGTGTTQARFELKGTTQTLGGLDSTGYTGAFAAIQHSEFSAGTPVDNTSVLIVDVSGVNSYTYGSTTAIIRDWNGPAGAMSLVKNGTGTQILSGAAMSYTGGTTVNAGTLVHDASARSGTITLGANAVAANGTLRLTNTATGIDNTLLQNTTFTG